MDMQRRFGLLVVVAVSVAVVAVFMGCTGEGPEPGLNVVENSGDTRLQTVESPDGPTTVEQTGVNTYRLTVAGQVLENVLAPVPPVVGAPLLIFLAGSTPLAFPGLVTEDTFEVEQAETRQRQFVTVPVDRRGGVMLQPVGVRPGKICEIAFNLVFTDPRGRRLAVRRFKICYIVYVQGVAVKSTFPTFVRFKLPQVGEVIENAFVEFRVDPSAATLYPPVRGRLRVVHGNGEINISNVPVLADGTVLFQARPGGPVLGPVDSVEVDITN